VSLEVLPTTDAGEDRVLLAVADQGPGMTEEARAKVFERFYRADPSRTRAAGGSGLGLSIVAALVAAHGGRVGVQSEPGAGSRFLVELPQYHPGEHAVDEPGDVEPGESGTADPDVTRSDLTQVAEDSQAGHRLSGHDDEEPSPSRTL
jgi:two-component system OmpR family sensor kinase